MGRFAIAVGVLALVACGAEEPPEIAVEEDTIVIEEAVIPEETPPVSAAPEGEAVPGMPKETDEGATGATPE